MTKQGKFIQQVLDNIKKTKIWLIGVREKQPDRKHGIIYLLTEIIIEKFSNMRRVKNTLK